MLVQAIAKLCVDYLRVLERNGNVEIRRVGNKIVVRRSYEKRGNLCKVFNSEAGQEEHKGSGSNLSD